MFIEVHRGESPMLVNTDQIVRVYENTYGTAIMMRGSYGSNTCQELSVAESLQEVKDMLIKAENEQIEKTIKHIERIAERVSRRIKEEE